MLDVEDCATQVPPAVAQHTKKSIQHKRSGKPQVSILTHTKRRVEFLLSGTDLSVANSLRRVALAEVPTIAIAEVTIIKNTSILTHDFLIHRLELVPLATNGATSALLLSGDECECENGCVICTREFSLDVTNTDDTNRIVSTRDIGWKKRPTDGDGKYDDCIMMANTQDPIVIVELAKNQTLQATLLAKKGIGKDHAKWVAATTVTFRDRPIVELEAKLLSTLEPYVQQEFVKSCPMRVFVHRGGGVAVANALQCTMCQECVRIANNMGHPKMVTLRENPNDYLFTVETRGTLPPGHIVICALRVLQRKLTELEDLFTEE